jgi:hypothetical protein
VVVSNLSQCVGVATGGWVHLRIRASAVGGRCHYVRWQQWLKVAKAEGVGPIRCREKHRKKILGEKKK